MTVLAISADTPEDSRAFAQDYGIGYPLLSDPDGAVARAYAGVTSDSNALPGVTIIDRGGRIAFRQLASSKDDRMPADELLATLDRTLGTSGPPIARTGYAAFERAQLRVALGGGGARAQGADRGAIVARVAGLYPLHRHVLAGPWLGFEPRDGRLDLDAAVVLRAPLWSNTGAIELALAGGYTPWSGGATGGNAAAHAGIWFAMSPRWALQLDVGVARYGLGDSSQATELTASLGVTRLFRLGR